MNAIIAQIAVLEEKLEKLLFTLKQNKEQVSPETLKTYYSIPYKALTEDIRCTLSDYVKALVCNGLYINVADLEESVEIINSTVHKSNILKFISTATFKEYDLKKVYSLAITLRTLIIKALLPILDRHTFYCLDSDTMNATGLIYNTALKCFFIEDAWVMLDQPPGLLCSKL